MRFGVLGPLEVRVDGEVVAIGGPQQRRILALLLQRPGHTVSTTRMVDCLWDEGAAPDGAMLDALAQAYAAKKERDRESLERMVAYAQSGRCRWRLLLEHFEGAPDVERCGTCDNCRHLAENAAQAAQPDPVDTRPPAESAAFQVGDLVRTRRHGTGSVVAADAHQRQHKLADQHRAADDCADQE